MYRQGPSSVSNNEEELYNAMNKRDEGDDAESMTKQIFNLKLKIFYLEEALSRDRGAVSNSDLAEDNLQMKLLLEEKTQELEERNLLLVKARNAIESIQTDLELARAEADEYRRNGFNLASKRLMESEEVIGRAEARVAALVQSEAAKKETIDKLSAALDESRKIISSQSSTIKSLESSKESMNHQIIAKDREIESHLSDIDRVKVMQIEKLAAEESVRKTEAQLVRFQQEINLLQGQLEEQGGQLEEVLLRESDFRNKATAASSHEAGELSKIKEHVKLLEGENNTLKQDLKATQDSKSVLLLEISSLKSTVSQTEVSVKQLTSDKAILVEKEKGLLKILLEAENKLAVAETESRDALSRIDIDHAKLEAALRREFADRESAHHSEINALQGKVITLEAAKANVEAKMAMREEALGQRILELQGKLKVEGEERAALVASTLPKTQHDLLINSLRADHERYLSTVTKDQDRMMKERARIDVERLAIERKLREGAEEDARAACARVDEAHRVCKAKLLEWEKAVIAQLGSWTITDTVSVVSSMAPRGHIGTTIKGGSELMDLGSDVTITSSSPRSLSDANYSESDDADEGGPGSNLLRFLHRARHIKSVFQEVVKRAEDKHLGLIQKLNGTILARDGEIRLAEKRIAHLHDEYQRLYQLQQMSNAENQKAVGANRASLLHMQKEFDMQRCDLERKLKIVDGEKSSLESDLEESTLLVKGLQEASSSLRRQLETVTSENTALLDQREDLTAKNDSFISANRTLMLQLEEQRGVNERLDKSYSDAKKEIESLSAETEGLKRQVHDQDEKLKEYVSQLEQYVDMLDKERGRKEELEEVVLKQVEETRNMIKGATAADSTRRSSSNTGTPSRRGSLKAADFRSAPSAVPIAEEERLMILKGLEQCQQRLEMVVSELVKVAARSNEAYYKFDRYLKSDPEGHSNWIVPVENELIELLDKNGRVTQQLSRLSQDLETFYRKFKKVESLVLSVVDQQGKGGGAASPDKKLAALHMDFVKRLGKIGGDLQDTASKLKKYHSDSAMG